MQDYGGKKLSEGAYERRKRETIRIVHAELGHSGINATHIFLKNSPEWLGTKEDVIDVIKQCEICQRYASRRRKGEMVRIEVKSPFYRVGIDIVGPLPRSRTGKRYIVAATDHLTRWCEARALKTKEASQVAKFIIE